MPGLESSWMLFSKEGQQWVLPGWRGVAVVMGVGCGMGMWGAACGGCASCVVVHMVEMLGVAGYEAACEGQRRRPVEAKQIILVLPLATPSLSLSQVVGLLMTHNAQTALSFHGIHKRRSLHLPPCQLISTAAATARPRRWWVCC